MSQEVAANFATQYQRELEQKTLKVGIPSAIIAIIGSTSFYYLDLVDLQLDGTLLWRLIGVFGGVIFLLSRAIKPLRPYVIQVHAVAMICYLLMMSGIAYLIFKDPAASQKNLFAITSGSITVWFILSLIAQGARRIMLYAGIVLVLGTTILYVLTTSSVSDNVGYIFSIFMIGVFAVMTMRNQAKYDYERAYNMFMLEESRDQVSRQAADLQNKNDNLIMFSRAMSHDLQGPLRRVRSFLDLYQFRSKDNLPEDTQEYLDLARQHLDQGQKVVHDLLVYAKIGQNELHKEEVDLKELCSKIFTEQLQEEEQQPAVTYVLDLEDNVLGDRNLLWYLFSNLISNGIKFTSKQSDPQITVRSRSTDEETIVSVVDNGIGFDESFLKELGRPFKRFHGTEYAGTGIGLSIVNQIAKMHGGRFWAESPEGKGATFSCAFPKK